MVHHADTEIDVEHGILGYLVDALVAHFDIRESGQVLPRPPQGPVIHSHDEAQDLFIASEDDCRCESDCAGEGEGTTAVSHGDAQLVLELSEHNLDAVALAVEHGIVRDRDFPAAG